VLEGKEGRKEWLVLNKMQIRMRKKIKRKEERKRNKK